jgi:hypothetical protein
MLSRISHFGAEAFDFQLKHRANNDNGQTKRQENEEQKKSSDNLQTQNGVNS